MNDFLRHDMAHVRYQYRTLFASRDCTSMTCFQEHISFYSLGRGGLSLVIVFCCLPILRSSIKRLANRYTFLLRPVVVDGQSISFFFLRQSVLLFLNIEAPPSRQGASYDITTHLELGFTIYDNDSTTNNRRKNIFPKRAN
jgi:hypothetical protein